MKNKEDSIINDMLNGEPVTPSSLNEPPYTILGSLLSS